MSVDSDRGRTAGEAPAARDASVAGESSAAPPIFCVAESAEEFFERAWDFLAAGEAEHNLLLGMAGGLISGKHHYDSPILLGWVEQGGEVTGYAFRTPPHKLGVSRLPTAVIPQIIDAVAELYPTLPAVMGPAETSQAVAQAWADRFGGEVTPGMRLRIHELRSVTLPDPPVPGRLRRAEWSDLDLTIDYLKGFLADTGIDSSDPEVNCRRMIDAGGLFLWEDEAGAVVSMAGASGATPNGYRIGYVYTPPEERGKGYASGCVGALSEHFLATGRTRLHLYTDLANPISNRIYARLGYKPVCDVADFHID